MNKLVVELAKCSEYSTDFRLLGLGRLFVYVDPPEKFEKVKNRVFIKLASNRIQILDDPSNTITPFYGEVVEVYIMARMDRC